MLAELSEFLARYIDSGPEALAVAFIAGVATGWLLS